MQGAPVCSLTDSWRPYVGARSPCLLTHTHGDPMLVQGAPVCSLTDSWRPYVSARSPCLLTHRLMEEDFQATVHLKRILQELVCSQLTQRLSGYETFLNQTLKKVPLIRNINVKSGQTVNKNKSQCFEYLPPNYSQWYFLRHQPPLSGQISTSPGW